MKNRCVRRTPWTQLFRGLGNRGPSSARAPLDPTFREVESTFAPESYLSLSLVPHAESSSRFSSGFRLTGPRIALSSQWLTILFVPLSTAAIAGAPILAWDCKDQGYLVTSDGIVKGDSFVRCAPVHPILGHRQDTDP